MTYGLNLLSEVIRVCRHCRKSWVLSSYSGSQKKVVIRLGWVSLDGVGNDLGMIDEAVMPCACRQLGNFMN